MEARGDVVSPLRIRHSDSVANVIGSRIRALRRRSIDKIGGNRRPLLRKAFKG